MPNPPSEADIIFNRASVALARSQRLVASWLPPPTASDLANAKSEEELEREEQEMFTPVPELLGLGASISKEGEIKRQKETTDDFLRKQLLGREYKKLQSNRGSEGIRSGLGVGQTGVKSRPSYIKRPVDESDDEGGRSSLGRSKRPKPEKELQNGTLNSAVTKVEAVHPNVSTASTASQSSIISSNYLDEVLADRSRKKSKKNKKKKRRNIVAIAAE
ncbi:hypothetical protein MMC07_008643 [Pseudocyphellaria aurata]|nr:hypothetical protein [Pseudocyphellaria aurata]